MRIWNTLNVQRFLALFTLCFLFATANVNADVVEFNSRADFENEITGVMMFDFEDQPTNATSGVRLGQSVDFGDATIFVDNIGGDANVFSTNQFGAPTVQISSLNGIPLTVSLSPGYRAIGMDIGSLFGTSTFDLTLEGPSGVLLDISRNVADNDDLGTENTTFFGFVSDSDEIRSLRISAATGTSNAFETIDNLIFGTTAVPEPTSVTILLVLGSIHAVRRRKLI